MILIFFVCTRDFTLAGIRLRFRSFKRKSIQEHRQESHQLVFREFLKDFLTEAINPATNLNIPRSQDSFSKTSEDLEVLGFDVWFNAIIILIAGEADSVN